MIAALLLASAVPDCHKAVTQADMNICADQDFRRSDAALNVQWSRTLHYMRGIDAAGPADAKQQTFVAALLASQRAWLSYRDAECKLDGYEMRGGTGESMVYSTCLAELTNARTKQLRSLIWGR